MTAKLTKPWFVPKSYGFGTVPASWEGWTATAVVITVFGATAALVRGWLRWVLATIIVGVFAGIA
jgi:hypothetical protein